MTDVLPVEEIPTGAKRQTFPILDALRGGAALYVVMYHSIDLLTRSGKDFHTIGPARMLTRGNMLGLFGYGHSAVLLFFLLSGFVIHLRQAPAASAAINDKAEWLKSYAWRRSIRIYPPLIAALAITALLAEIGWRVSPHLYGHVLDHPTASTLVAHRGTWHEVWTVLVPWQGGQTFGADGALWSIGYELWFYLAYPALLFLVLARKRIPALAVTLAALVLGEALNLTLGHFPSALPGVLKPLVPVAMYYAFWIAGSYLAELWAKGVRLSANSQRLWGGAGIVIVLAAVATSKGDNTYFNDALWCAGFWAFMGASVLRDETYQPAVVTTLAKSAKWSYSLYLVHLPALAFGYGLVGSGTQKILNPLLVLTAVAFAVAVGLGLYAVVERPSVRLASRKGGLNLRLSSRTTLAGSGGRS